MSSRRSRSWGAASIPSCVLTLSSLALLVMAKFANNGSSVILQLSPLPAADNFIQCSFNPLCFCKYDQRTEIYDSLARLWQIVRFNKTEFRSAVGTLIQVMSQDPATIYYVTEGSVRSFSKDVANYSTATRDPLFQYGPVFYMECSDVPIALIPTDYNAHGVISHVSLTGSKLSILDASAFAGLEVQGIRLARNHLYYLSEYSFSSMSNSLTMLDLSANFLDEIPFHAFNSLKLLEWLNLSNNKLNSVTGDWLTISRTLRKLLLSSNSIDALPHKLFSTFPRLSWLDLTSNFIRNLSQDSLPPNVQTLNLMKNRFSNFPVNVLRSHSLSWLLLGGCAMESIPHEWPSGAPPLQMNQMDLSENLIQIWPGRAFGGQLTLLDLSVSKNFVQSLPSGSFESMNIFRLSLGYNRIHRIDPAAFHSLESSLKYLNLENNRLQEIPWTALNNLTSLMHFYIGSNFIQDEGLGTPAIGGERRILAECKLTYLGLNGNQLSRVPLLLLTRCPRLVHLNLGYNQIVHLDDLAAVRRPLRSLSTLILRNNPIRTLAFINTNHIQSDGPPLPQSPPTTTSKSNIDNLISPTKIPLELDKGNEVGGEGDGDGEGGRDEAFGGSQPFSIPNVFRVEVFPNLRELSLSFCQLAGELEGFPALPLTTLEISMGLSSTTTLTPGTFQGLRHLEWLALDHNTLHTIRDYTFYGNRKLNYVNLEWNRLGVLPPQMFHPEIHPSITHLRLSHNVITTIMSNSFISFPAINLDLSYNFIHTIERGAFSEFDPAFSPGGRGSTDPLITNPTNYSPPNGSHVIVESSPPPTPASVPSFFSDLPGLNLYLTHNRLSSLRSGSFAANKFALVDLSYNRLRTLNFDAFGGQTMVGGLNGSHNEIERLSLGSFRILLKFLDLSHNRISNGAIDLRTLCVSDLIDLSNNRLEELNSNILPLNCSVKILDFRMNTIKTVDPGTFKNLPDLTVLHLEWNQITQFSPITLIRNTKLKYLDLSHNRLRTLPRDSLLGSSLETLELSWNQFVSIPVPALAQISRRLKRLDMSHNSIEHLDSTMFESIPGLLYLNLSSNRLSTLPDSAFANLATLRELDLSGNFLRTNFKELFHFLPKLKILRISGCGIKVLPLLPLPHLVSLDLSSNAMAEIKVQSLASLARLRHLDLSANDLSSSRLPNWTPLHNLVTLDLSRNPLKSLTKDTLFGLGKLESLELMGLGRLDRFDSDVFSHLPNLRYLAVETHPNIEKYRFRLGTVLSSISHLEELHVVVREPILSDQLLGAILPKLRKLRISGQELRKIESGALEGLQDCFHMDLTISQTSIEEIPPKVFELLQNAAWARLDLSHNKISSLDWASLYSNKTVWFSRGTKTFEGGLVLDGNEFICDCDLVWIGEWLRRWLRESFQSHSTDNIPLVHGMYESIRRPTCMDSNGRSLPLIDLYSDAMCHASALSGAQKSLSTILTFILPMASASLFHPSISSYFY